MQKLELQSSAANDRLSRPAYCEKHGEYVEAGRNIFGHVVWFGCAKCSEEERKHQAELEKLEEARGRAWSYRQLFGEWLPKAFDFPLESFEVIDAAMGDAYCVAEEYVRNFYRYRSEGRGLFFTGTAGTGKTKLACGVLKSLFPDVVGCYVTLSDLGDRVRQTWRSASGESAPFTEAQLLNAVYRAPLLVFDEIGTIAKPQDGELLFKVINTRYSNLLPTIGISNLSLTELCSLYSDRFSRRLEERSRTVVFDWTPWQERHQQNENGLFQEGER